MNMDYFNYAVGLTMTNKKFNYLFGGPPIKPESELTQREMDIARSVQEVTEEIVLKIAKNVRRVTKKIFMPCWWSRIELCFQWQVTSCRYF